MYQLMVHQKIIFFCLEIFIKKKVLMFYNTTLSKQNSFLKLILLWKFSKIQKNKENSIMNPCVLILQLQQLPCGQFCVPT